MLRLPGRRSAPSPQIVAKVLFGLFEAEHANRSQRDRVHMALLDGEVRKIAGSFHFTTSPARTDGRPNRPSSEPGPTIWSRPRTGQRPLRKPAGTASNSLGRNREGGGEKLPVEVVRCVRQGVLCPDEGRAVRQAGRRFYPPPCGGFFHGSIAHCAAACRSVCSSSSRRRASSRSSPRKYSLP